MELLRKVEGERNEIEFVRIAELIVIKKSLNDCSGYSYIVFVGYNRIGQVGQWQLGKVIRLGQS